MNLSDVVKFSWPYVRRHNRLFLFVGALVLFSAFLAIPLPFISRYVIDVVIPARDYHALTLLSGLFIAILLVERTAVYFHGVVMFSLTRQLMTALRRDFLASMFVSSLLAVQQHSTTYLMARVQQDSDQIFGQFIDNVIASFEDLAIVICGLGAIFYLNWKLSLLAIFILPAYVLAARRFSGKIQVQTKTYYEALALEKARLQEALSALDLAKFYSGRMILNLYFSSALDVLRAGAAMMKTRAMSSSLAGFFSEIMPILILILGAVQIMRGDMTIGSLVAFTSFSAYLFAPSKRLVDFYVNAHASVASVERLHEIFGMPKDTAPTGGIDFKIISRINITDLSFSYGKDKTSIDVPDFELRRGAITGIVGPSGSGKTTFIRVLTGLYDWQSGKLRIDSAECNNSALKSLRHKAAIIEQEPKILRGPLSLNLRLGDSTASKERILEAAYRAQLKDLILGEPDGISMNLLEGGKNLSVGQKQRIAIARAILKDTELIIFDEPTASLDAATEKVIVDLIQELSKEKFVIIISHKSATTDICESIYTFSSGALTKTK